MGRTQDELKMADSNVDAARITDSVDAKVRLVRTKSLDLSFNELADMYSTAELVIAPEYQRLFRWSEGKQSRFIESLILELPIPPIFVIEREESTYELIDGLQRISTYLNFRGLLPQEMLPEDQTVDLALSECDIVRELNGVTFKSLPRPLEIKLKRNFVRVEVLRKESDARLRYYMFKRLNTGGEPLSEQEIRNCTIRLLNNQFNELLSTLSTDPDFRTCIAPVSQEKIRELYDRELVLRFFAIKNYRDAYEHEVGEFLTEYMERVSDPADAEVTFDFGGEPGNFERTFAALARAVGETVLTRSTPEGASTGQFSVYLFEALSIGLQSVLQRLDLDSADHMARLRQRIEEVKRDADFRAITTGGGKNYPNPLRDRIAFVQVRLEQEFPA